MSKSPLETLKGKKLSAIVFVQDYLQIQFDGDVITFSVYPKVDIDNETFSFGENEYRNKICEFIGNIVVDIIYIEDEIFCLLFNGRKIYSSLNPNDYILPEMIVYAESNGSTVVF